MAGADIDESAMTELVAMQPSFFVEVSALLTAERLPAWQAWARWRVDQLAGAVPVQRLR